MRLKRFLAFVVAFAMVMSIVPAMSLTAFAEETVDTSIASLDDLKAFRDSVNNGNDYAGLTVELANDISLAGETWTPIGNGSRSGKSYSGNSFKGTFNGNGYTISGLVTVADADCAGLFGVLDGATVSDVEFTDVNINVTTKNAGALAGLAVNNSKISGIEVSGSVTAVDGAGGVLGRMTVEGEMSDCANNATVTATGSGGAGGIVGKAYYTEADKEMTISNCVNNGVVTSSYAAGGIVGLSAANVTGCKNTAVITAGTEAGGIVGEQVNYGEVTGNTNSAEIKNNGGGTAYGGIIGWVRYQKSTSDYANSEVITVSGNVNTGAVNADGANLGAGGIVGTIYNQANVTNNVNTAPYVKGGVFAAGIVGALQHADNNLTITDATITVNGNATNTAIENITVSNEANCVNLVAYNNDATAFIVESNVTNFDVIITTAEEFKAFAAEVNGGNTFSGKVVVLANDIDLAGSETNLWTPIGTNADAVYFAGTFDGQGYTISNLYVKQGAAYHAAGLFGAIRGTVKNFTIDTAYVESISSGSATDNGTAVVAGSSYNSSDNRIENVHVKNATVKGNRYVAGIVGYMDGTVTNCSVENVTIVATPDNLTGSYDNGDKVGGIVGYCNSNAVEITNCELKGNVDITAYRDVAGIVGCTQSDVKVNNNTNNAQLTITIDTTLCGERDSYNVGEFVGRNTPAEATGNTTTATATYEYSVVVAPTVYEVATKAELNTAIADAAEGDVILLTADIDYGTDQLKIEKAITLDLGTKTLTTRNAYGGTSLKNGPSIKNGTIVHASNTAAIKAWNVGALEDLVIDVQGKGDANKTIGGIVVQNVATNRIDTIKNVTIKGEALTNGIETYNCGDAAESVIGSMENVIIDANGTGMLISAPCGTATNCDITGGVSGIELWIKGNYSATLDLVGCTVEGGTQAVYVHDEFKDGVVNNGTLSLTVDDETELVNENGAVLTLINAHESNFVVDEDVLEAGVAKIGDTYYTTLEEAIAAAEAGDTVTIFEGTYAVPTMKAGITVVGEGSVVLEGTLKGTLENLTLKNLHIKGGNAQRWAYAKGDCTFENVTFEATSVYALHFDGITEGANLLYKDCTIIGWAAMGGSPASCVFDGCTIKDNGRYGVIRTYFDTTIKNCTFDVDGANTTDVYEDGIHSVGDTTVVTVENCTNSNGSMEDIINVSGASVVMLDGAKIQNVAKIGDEYYATLEEAITAVGAGDVVIELLADATMDYSAREAYGTSETTSLTINGNGNTLTLNQTNSDWSSFGLANADAKLVLNNMTVEKTGYGDTSGAWNTHAINFTCEVEMNNVTVNNSMSVEDGATLNNVTINEANGYYGLWIDGNGQSVVVNGGAINATNGGRGIKIADEYVGEAVAKVTLNVDGTTFNTAKKAAVLVSSTAGATVTASNVDITNVAADSTNFVWVDEDWSDYYNNVEVTGATKWLEAGALVAKVGETSYFSLQAAIDAANEGDTVTLISDITLTDAVEVDADDEITLDLAGYTVSQEKACTGHYAMITNKGNLTITDSSADKTGKISFTDTGAGDASFGWGSYTVYNYGTLTVESGTIENLTQLNASGAVHMYSAISQYQGSTTINGGTISTPTYRSVRVNQGDLTVNGGVLDGQVWMHAFSNDISLTINGGTFAPNGVDGSSVFVTNSTYTVELAVTGGTFETKIGCSDANALAGAITGGTFTAAAKENTNAALIAEGYEFVENSDGTYGVEEFDYVAWVQDELLAGRSVTLDRDIVVDGSYIESIAHAVNSNGKYPNFAIFTVVGDYDVTVDLNGYDIVYNGHADFEWKGKTYNSCTVAHGLFFANGGADLTIIDSVGTSDITVYGMASGAYVATPDTTFTIKGGTWKNHGCETCGGTNIFLYPLQGGELYIEGGYFEQDLDSEGESYLIVEHGGNMSNSVIDYSKTKVEISGGTFVGMNPSEIKKFYEDASGNDDYTLTTDGCESGFAGKENADGTFGIVEAVATVTDSEGNSRGYETFAEAITAAQSGDTVTIIADGTYTLPSSIQKAITIEGYDKEAVVIDFGGTYNTPVAGVTDITFKNLTIDRTNNVDYVGFHHATKETYDNCIINGELWTYAVDAVITGCTFNQTDAGQYNLWTYGAGTLTVTNSTFNCNGRCVLIYNENGVENNVTFNTVTFVANNTVADKAAVEINSSLFSEGKQFTVAINNSTATGFGTETKSGSSLWNEKKESDKAVVTVDGEKVWPIVPEGTITYGYTSQSAIWGEGKSNATESYVVELYVGEDKIATASLNDIGNIIDGTYKNITWSIPFAGSTDEYWSVEWIEAPSKDRQPTAVKLVVDGVTVAENVVKMSGPDDMNKVVWEDLEIFKNYVAEVDGVKFESLQDAFDAAEAGQTVTLLSDIVLDASVTVAKDDEIVLDLAGLAITGTDTTEKNFGLINNNGNLTVNDSVGTGSITLTATVNSGWNRYSAVISNNPGGTLVVNGGTIEHLGGTDMAYGIDSLTNSNIAPVSVTVNGGTIKSTYRGIRQFLNSDETPNSLTINGGTVEGANKAIFVHDPSTKANVGAITIAEEATITGGTYLFVTAGSTEYPVEVSIAAGEVTTKNLPEGYELVNNNGVYTVIEIPALPTATVTDISADELTEENAPELTFAKKFTAVEPTAEQLAYYGDWYADFELTVSEKVTFNADGNADGYLAGEYGTYGWISVPFEDVTLEAGETLKIMEYAAELMGQSGLKVTYNDVATGVVEFDCGVFFEDLFLIENPDLEVTLELRMYNPENEEESYVIGETYTFEDAEVEAPALPTATVTDISADELTEENAPELTFAKKFTAVEPTAEQLAYYGDWYADFELTVSEKVTFNAGSETADGYLAGEYGTYGWISVPFEDVTLEAGETLKIMEYAAELMGQSGLKVTYNDVATGVVEFDCGVFFTPEFIRANPDLEVTLELRMYNPENEEESYVIGETYTFEDPVLPVAQIGEVGYYDLQSAFDEVTADGTIELLADNAENVTVYALGDAVNLTTGDYTYTGTVTLDAGAWIVADEEITVQVAADYAEDLPVVKGEGNGKFGYAAMYMGVNLKNGAQVRIGSGVDEDGKIKNSGSVMSGSGLRFITEVDRNETLASHADVPAAGDQNYTKFVVGVNVRAEDSADVASIPAYYWQTDNIFTTALTNLPVSNYVREFTATTYVEVDGIRYESNTSVTRSIYQVAAGLLITGDAEVDSDGNHTYDPSEEALIEVLNAYVNQTGIRLVLMENEEVNHYELKAHDGTTGSTKGGDYGYDAYFTVSETTYDPTENSYTVTLEAQGNAKIYDDVYGNEDFWFEYVRINNNNSKIREKVEVTEIEEGKKYTLKFKADGIVDPMDNTGSFGGEYEGDNEEDI